MARRAIILASIAVVGAALAAPAAGAACPRPRALTATAHTTSVVLRWSPSRGRHARRPSFRVLRGHTVVGQTRARAMRVSVRPGRTVRLGVGVVRAGGRAPRCYAQLTVRVARRKTTAVALAAPKDLAVADVTDRRATASWSAVPAAAAYRVFRDGKVVSQTAHPALTVGISAGRPSILSVAAVARGGRLGARSAPLTVNPGHRAPASPRGLSVSDVAATSFTASWQPATPGSAPIRAYRVLRNGRVVGQTARTSMRLVNLVPLAQYQLSIVAVDSQGYTSAPASVTSNAGFPEQTHGTAQAFLLASTDASFDAFQANYRQVGTVYPTYYDCSAKDPSAITGHDDARITDFAKTHGVRILPRFNCQRPGTFRAVFADAGIRTALIQNLVTLVERYDYDGINLDFEAGAPADRPGLTAFAGALADALHAVGRRLTIDVSPKFRDVPNHPRSTFFDYVALAQRVDQVIVMSWGLHWTTSVPGAAVDLGWLRQIIAYVRTMRDPGRFVIATSAYGLDWAGGGGVARPATAMGNDDMRALIARLGATPVRDPASAELHFSYTDAAGVPHEVWFRDAAAVEASLSPARAAGIGVAFWRLGQEDPALWSQPSIG